MAEHEHSGRKEGGLDIKVNCEVCLQEIPATEARSAEGQDYVLYFCGLDCYDKWREKGEAAEESGHEE